jgi:hypothetical protein
MSDNVGRIVQLTWKDKILDSIDPSRITERHYRKRIKQLKEENAILREQMQRMIDVCEAKGGRDE